MFTTPKLDTFYTTRGISLKPVGPLTPWPNRAEAAVRIFKRHVFQLCEDLRGNPIRKSARYGIASAQYHWGRMATLILRMLYYTFPEIQWACPGLSPLPLKSTDVVRRTYTDLESNAQHLVSDFWTEIGRRDLSEEWTCKIVFHLLRPPPPPGYKWIVDLQKHKRPKDPITFGQKDGTA